MKLKNNFSALEKINHPLFTQHKVQVEIKRDDLLHPIISGNKWRKLKYNLEHLKKQGYSGALTFGGSYSNHIHAFAFACYQLGLPCLGIIRGEAQYENNYTLSWAKHWGMQCHFVDRKTYRRRFDDDFLLELSQQYPNFFIIPEGGSNKLAVEGVSEIIAELAQQTQFDTLLTPVGSGGTLAGLIDGDSQLFETKSQHKLLGIAVLKQAEYLSNEIKALLSEQGKTHQNWQLMTQFHRGGYGKFSPEDLTRIIRFNEQSQLTFEPVYSGKMLLALLDLLEQGYFKANERIVLLHTGGLQGLGGMIEQQRLRANDWPKLPLP
ncbi:pyridoxal-phosphate dependent enzyme [Colwellia asteriadis]|uniref:Pyridoxal-phosphate dependent enzyme n=1 Tax=Colwellia asteriadis TaxID=517723 RepID=A0ABN1L3D7_9GAMM